MPAKRTEPTRKLILKREKFETMNIVVKLGFNPNDFEWQTSSSRVTRNLEVSVLAYKTTAFFFAFDYVKIDYLGKFLNRWSVRSPGWHEPEDGRFEGSWQSQEGYFYDWLDLLKKEIATPDVWSNFASENAFHNILPLSEEENRPFTQEEMRVVSTHLRQIEQNIIKAISSKHLADSQSEKNVKETIQRQFEYLDNAAQRVGRVDWKNLVSNSIVTIVISAIFAPDARAEVFRLLIDAFDMLLKAKDLLP